MQKWAELSPSATSLLERREQKSKEFSVASGCKGGVGDFGEACKHKVNFERIQVKIPFPSGFLFQIHSSKTQEHTLPNYYGGEQ